MTTNDALLDVCAGLDGQADRLRAQADTLARSARAIHGLGRFDEAGRMIQQSHRLALEADEALQQSRHLRQFLECPC